MDIVETHNRDLYIDHIFYYMCSLFYTLGLTDGVYGVQIFVIKH